MDCIEITNDENYFVQWKLFSESVSVSDRFVSVVQNTCSNFVSRFLSIPKGEVEELRKECFGVVDLFRSYIPNFDCYYCYLEETSKATFNKLHESADELKLEKARELVKILKLKYEFSEIYKPLLFSEVAFKDQQEKLLSKIFELKEFKAKKVYDLFMYYVKEFFKGLSGSNISDFLRQCQRSEKEFNDQIANLIESCKVSIEKYFNGIIQRKYCVLYLKSMQIHPAIANSDWKTSFYGSFELEDFELKQVLPLSNQIYVAMISFMKSRNNIMVLLTPFGSTMIKNSNFDHKAVIVSGSSPSKILIYLNTQNVLIKGHLSNKLEFVHLERFQMRNIPGNISSAALLKPNKEIFFVNVKGEFSYFSLTDKKRNVEHLDHFKYKKVESAGNFLIFYLFNEVFMVDKTFQKIYMENKEYQHCCLVNKTLVLLDFDGESDSRVKRFEISDEYFEKKGWAAKLIDDTGNYFCPENQMIYEFFVRLKPGDESLTGSFVNIVRGVTGNFY